jgi:glycosyltransferase involved in cell wall biosynthesis
MMKIAMLTGNTGSVRSGMHNYIFHLVGQLKKHRDVDLTLVTGTGNEIFPDLRTITPFCPYPGFSSFFWSQCISLRKKMFREFDLVHNPAHYPFLLKPGKKVVCTIHDITPVLFPQYHPRWRSLYTGIGIPRLVSSSERIIVDSLQTKKDLINRYQVPETRISVIYLGASEEFKKLDSHAIESIRHKYHLDFPYILFVGNLEPRKNIPNMIRAFSQCPDRSHELHLVIAGKKGWMFEEIFRTVTELHLEKSVRFLDYILDEDLPALYNAATAFVYVPFYEGFGLPPLEAMQCGTPVITSNTSSLPEIVGRGGIMVDPRDVQGLAKKIHLLVSDENARAENSRYNLLQCRKFSWEKCAAQTLEVYREVIEGESSTI